MQNLESQTNGIDILSNGHLGSLLRVFTEWIQKPRLRLMTMRPVSICHPDGILTKLTFVIHYSGRDPLGKSCDPVNWTGPTKVHFACVTTMPCSKNIRVKTVYDELRVTWDYLNSGQKAKIDVLLSGCVHSKYEQCVMASIKGVRLIRKDLVFRGWLILLSVPVAIVAGLAVGMGVAHFAPEKSDTVAGFASIVLVSTLTLVMWHKKWLQYGGLIRKRSAADRFGDAPGPNRV